MHDDKLIAISIFHSGNRDRDAPSIVLPHQDASYISHIALDIGGSLIKLVYFSSDKPGSDEKPTRSSSNGSSSSHTGGKVMRLMLR